MMKKDRQDLRKKIRIYDVLTSYESYDVLSSYSTWGNRTIEVNAILIYAVDEIYEKITEWNRHEFVPFLANGLYCIEG